MKPLVETVVDVVLHHLTDVTGRPREKIRLTDRVVQDLNISGDDIDFILVPRIERDLDVRLKPEAWAAMRTVGDAVEALRAAVRSNQKDSSGEQS